MKKIIIVLLLGMLMFSSCTDSNERKIVGTWTDTEGITWVFTADGKLTYANRPGDSREYKYSVFDGERRTELTIFDVTYDLYVATGISDQKYSVEYSKDGKTLRLTGGKDLNGWDVAGPGMSTNQLTRTGTTSSQNNGSISKNLIGKWEVQKIIEPDGEEITFPGEYLQHAGVHYEKNGFTTYINGSSPRGFRSAYTKGNKLYFSEFTSEWSIKNGILTVKDSDDNGGETVIQKKVEKFSWE